MGMVEDFGKVILINKATIGGGRSDIKTFYTFKNTFCSYEDLIKEVQRLENAQSVQKGTEKWLECTHELSASDENVVVIKFVFPYCG